MTDGVAIPLHLAVYVLGVTVALGLTVHALVRRRAAATAPATWIGLALGGALVAAGHLGAGALIGSGAWPIYARTAGYAAIAYAAVGGVRVSAVAVVIAPLGVHVAAAGAAVLAGVACLRGVLGRGRVVVLLALGLALWGGADLMVRTSPVAAAGLSLAGSLAVGGWLAREARHSLLARFVAAFMAVLLVLVIGLAAASGVLFSVDLERDQLATIEGLAAGQSAQVEQEWPRDLARIAAPLAGDTLSAELVAAGDGALGDLDRRAQAVAGLPGVDVVVLLDRGGRVVGSWDPLTVPPGPVSPADQLVLAGDERVAAAFAGTPASGLAPVGDRELVALATIPVAPRAADDSPRLDRISGVLLVGRRASDARVAAAIRAQTGTNATVLVGGEPVSSTLGPADAAAVAVLATNGGPAQTIRIGGEPRYFATAPIRATDGAALGAVALTLSASTLGDAEEDFTRALFGVALAGVILAALLAAAAANRTSRPVRALTAAAEEIARGDLEVRMNLRRHDEVGRLADAFDAMTVALAQREGDLRAAAATEAALRTRIEIVTASMGEALVASDRDARVTSVNRAAEELLAAGRDDLVGRPIGDVLTGSTTAGESLTDALGTGGERLSETRGSLDPGGAVGRARPIAATSAPLTGSDGAVLGRVYVLRDISGEVEIERMKTEFLSNISHELRTPLTPIKAYAEVLRSRRVEPERAAEFAEHIATSARRLERIVAMLVDFAALEAGRTQVTLESTDVVAVVDDMLERWRSSEPQRSFRRVADTPVAPAVVDPDLLARVLEELLDNAVKFSDDEVSVLVDGDGGSVRLTVRDLGPGISEDQLTTILEDFRQADGSATRRYGGLGLGLSIVQRILERFAADITIAPGPDHGTDVVVTLPEDHDSAREIAPAWVASVTHQGQEVVR